MTILSIILPVCDTAPALDRAIRSVQRQTFNEWELLVIDRGGSSESAAELRRLTARDGRIRILPRSEPASAGAARNEGLRQARGEYVCYLDADDEYFADHLAHVASFRDKAEVLIFGYEIAQPVESQSCSPGQFDWSLEGFESSQLVERVVEWAPARFQSNLFAVNIAKPLAVAHRRDLGRRVGEFNELVWAGEDWDYWKRLARSGVEFLFLPLKSGKYHVPPKPRNEARRLTATQRELVLANWEAGRPIFSSPLGQAYTRPVRKLVYTAPHCLIDPTSGAAVATAQAMRFLQTLGFQCKAFCGSRLDFPEDIETMLQRHQIAYRRSLMDIGCSQISVFLASFCGFSAGGSAEALEVTVFPNEFEQQTDFYRACGSFLDAHRPDAVVTYGADPLADTLIRLAKNRDLPLVFWLHNFAYHDPQAFALADYVIVPSSFNRQYYWEHLGLACKVMPLVVDWQRVEVAKCPQPNPLPEGEGTKGSPHANQLTVGRGNLHVTFVNPQRTKGLYIFARIAEVLSKRRPDIPLLVMAGRSRAGWQEETGIDLARFSNVTISSSVPDPREFYAVTKMLLMPSLWNESFGLVAAEAMINGIPVLASNRGALPETIGDAGFLFDIPVKYTPETRELPTTEEIEPWVETIIRLWDDPAWYDRWSRAARERSRQWHPDRLVPVYREFFGRLTHQPGPPRLPREEPYVDA